MKIKKILSFLVAAALLIAAFASVLSIIGCKKNSENGDQAVTAGPGSDSSAQPNDSSADPDQQANNAETTPDPDTSADPDDPDATPDGGAHLIESGGDIEIIIPTGQSSGGL